MKGKEALRLLLIIVGILALDIASKNLTQFYFSPYGHSSYMYPFGGISIFQFFGIDFCIHHVTNQGAAWGIGSSWQTLLLIARIAVVASLGVYLCFSQKAFSRRCGFALIVAGGLGNIIDYFIYGHVIDMFHFIFWGYSYPVFNVADISIFFGIVSLLWTGKRTQNSLPQDVTAQNQS